MMTEYIRKAFVGLIIVGIILILIGGMTFLRVGLPMSDMTQEMLLEKQAIIKTGGAYLRYGAISCVLGGIGSIGVYIFDKK